MNETLVPTFRRLLVLETVSVPTFNQSPRSTDGSTVRGPDRGETGVGTQSEVEARRREK